MANRDYGGKPKKRKKKSAKSTSSQTRLQRLHKKTAPLWKDSLKQLEGELALPPRNAIIIMLCLMLGMLGYRLLSEQTPPQPVPPTQSRAPTPPPQAEWSYIDRLQQKAVTGLDKTQQAPAPLHHEPFPTDTVKADYQVQCGVFRQAQAAEALKAKLALGLGRTVQLATITREDKVLYRIYLAGFTGLADAEQVQQQLLDLGIEGCLLQKK